MDLSWNNLRSRARGGDRALWFIVIAMGMLSVLVVYSSLGASVYRPSGNDGSFFKVLLTQMMMVLAGWGAILVMQAVDFRYYKRYALVAYVLSLLLTLVPYLTGSDQPAERWIEIPIIRMSIQPSDPLKVTTIILLARNLARRIERKGPVPAQIIPPLLFWRQKRLSRRIWRDSTRHLVVPVVLSCAVVMVANLSTAMVIFFSSMLVLYIGGIDWRQIARMVLLLGAAAVLLLAVLYPLGLAPRRMKTWIHRVEYAVGINNETQDKADDYDYQMEQARIAIALGGMTGRGVGQSIQRNNLPLAESDYAFAFIVEEYGALLAGVLIFLYMGILGRAIAISRKCPSSPPGYSFPSILAPGLALQIVLQAVFHMLVSTDSMPPTGLTLPLISKGGSSELFISLALGMILGISRQINMLNTEKTA